MASIPVPPAAAGGYALSYLAVYAITRVCPYLLDRSRFFLKRIALAQEWCIFLSKLGEIDEEECNNIKGEEGIMRVVKKINEWAVRHASVERLRIP